MLKLTLYRGSGGTNLYNRRVIPCTKISRKCTINLAKLQISKIVLVELWIQLWILSVYLLFLINTGTNRNSNFWNIKSRLSQVIHSTWFSNLIFSKIKLWTKKIDSFNLFFVQEISPRLVVDLYPLCICNVIVPMYKLR